MNDRQTELLRLLKASLFGGGAAGLFCDPAALLSEAQRHGVLLLAVNDADPSLFPDDLRQELSHSVKRALERDLRIGNAHVMLSSLLESEGIGHTLIKGLASAVWYPAPELRQTGDVD
ncbi:MAG: nucleotidyltransferase family protein, partial [Clostridia bacterium]|nr:nucleotidyltransferase family protein [Clostridia bacterium]